LGEGGSADGGGADELASIELGHGWQSRVRWTRREAERIHRCTAM
jgi:hypothetical protein